MATAEEKEAKEATKDAARAAVTQGQQRLATEVGRAGRAFQGRRLRSAGDLSRYKVGGFLDDPNAPRPVTSTPGSTGSGSRPAPRPSMGGGSSSGSGTSTPRGPILSPRTQQPVSQPGAFGKPGATKTPYVNRPTAGQMTSGRDGGLMGNIAGPKPTGPGAPSSYTPSKGTGIGSSGGLVTKGSTKGGNTQAGIGSVGMTSTSKTGTGVASSGGLVTKGSTKGGNTATLTTAGKTTSVPSTSKTPNKAVATKTSTTVKGSQKGGNTATTTTKSKGTAAKGGATKGSTKGGNQAKAKTTTKGKSKAKTTTKKSGQNKATMKGKAAKTNTTKKKSTTKKSTTHAKKGAGGYSQK